MTIQCKLTLINPRFGFFTNLFDENDLLKRYPEVKKAYKSIRKIIKIGKQDKRYYVFYAAHAVSKITPFLRKVK